jgi:hypothetical protein
MDRRHDEILTNRLEEILTKGCTYIGWNELYLWYGVQRLAKRSYRDLSDRWDELVKQAGRKDLGKLSFVQSPMSRITPGMFLFGSDMPTIVDDYDD